MGVTTTCFGVQHLFQLESMRGLILFEAKNQKDQLGLPDNIQIGVCRSQSQSIPQLSNSNAQVVDEMPFEISEQLNQQISRGYK